MPASVRSQKLADCDFKSLASGLKEVEVLERTPTGRARKAQLSGADGKKAVTGVDLRRVLGYEKVRSLWFEVEKKRDGWLLSGKGFGHGAGMCQWGAKALAEQGWGYARILTYYYQGAQLRRMY